MDTVTLKQFLETIPPGKWVSVSDFSEDRRNGYFVAAPELNLHCTTDNCEGIRYFECNDDRWLAPKQPNHIFLHYVCRNCRRSLKTFAVASSLQKGSKIWRAFKFGEVPQFGLPIPARAISLVGGERDLFLLGRRCENQGMGIGAFVYYRRVIESQKNRIFDELIRVVGKVSPQDPVLNELDKAKAETSFTKAVESIKHVLPQSLLINGYNPLSLLHSALSKGVHEHSDEECLHLANSVRAVLVEFAERLGQALKDEAELNAAVNQLARPKNGS